MIRILIVDRDSERLRRTREALADHTDIEIVGEVASLAEVTWVVSQVSPDIVVLMEMSGAPRSLMRLLRLNQIHRPSTQFLVWTQPGPGLAQAIKAGLSGYLLKDLGEQDLVGAIRLASQSSAGIHGSAKRATAQKARPLEWHPGVALNVREIEILRLVAYGFTTKEVADLLSIAHSTILCHLESAFEKLGANDRTQAVAIAIRQGLVE